MKKKILALLLVATMACSVVACGNASDNNNEDYKARISELEKQIEDLQNLLETEDTTENNQTNSNELDDKIIGEWTGESERSCNFEENHTGKIGNREIIWSYDEKLGAIVIGFCDNNSLCFVQIEDNEDSTMSINISGTVLTKK